MPLIVRMPVPAVGVPDAVYVPAAAVGLAVAVTPEMPLALIAAARLFASPPIEVPL